MILKINPLTGQLIPVEPPGAGGGGGGAPTGAKYITQTPDATLTAEQALSVLGTGILQNTTGTGVLSIATAGTTYLAPTGSGAALTGITASQVGAEPALGNPGTTGYVLSSTLGGIRSWVAQAIGGAILALDGGDAAASGTPSVAIEGGTA